MCTGTMSDKQTIREFRALWSIDPQLYNTKLPIPDSFIHFDKVTKAKITGLENNHCYGNTLFIPKHKFNGQRKVFVSLKLCVGIVIRKECVWAYVNRPDLVANKFIIQAHAWNLNSKGEIADWTYGTERANNYVYLGVIIPDTIVKTFKNAPCVRKYLWKQLGLEPHQFFDTDTHWPTHFNEDYKEMTG